MPGLATQVCTVQHKCLHCSGYIRVGETERIVPYRNGNDRYMHTEELCQQIIASRSYAFPGPRKAAQFPVYFQKAWRREPVRYDLADA